jgi:glycosyltransferase involved in cell wall biosynthesis
MISYLFIPVLSFGAVTAKTPPIKRTRVLVDLRPVRDLGNSGTGVVISEQLHRLASSATIEVGICATQQQAKVFESIKRFERPVHGLCDVIYVPQQILRPTQCAVFDGPWAVVINQMDTILTDFPFYHPSVQHFQAMVGLHKWVLQNATGITTLTDASKRDCLRLVDVPPDKISVVPCGLDHPLVVPTSSCAEYPRREPFVLALGAAVNHKRRPFAVEVFAKLKERGYPGNLVLAGPQPIFGSTTFEEERTIKTSGLDQSVVRLGSVNEQTKAWLLHHADLVLCPSEAEGFGLIPGEAARCGTATLIEGIEAATEIYGSDATVSRGLGSDAWADLAMLLVRSEAHCKHQIQLVLSANERYKWSNSVSLLEHHLHRAANAAAATKHNNAGSKNYNIAAVRRFAELTLLGRRLVSDVRKKL